MNLMGQGPTLECLVDDNLPMEGLTFDMKRQSVAFTVSFFVTCDTSDEARPAAIDALQHQSLVVDDDTVSDVGMNLFALLSSPVKSVD
jgi:hypothetical protein